MDKRTIELGGTIEQNKVINDIIKKATDMKTAKPSKLKDTVKGWLLTKKEKDNKQRALAFGRRSKRASNWFRSFEQYYSYCTSFPSYKRKGNK